MEARLATCLPELMVPCVEARRDHSEWFINLQVTIFLGGALSNLWEEVTAFDRHRSHLLVQCFSICGTSPTWEMTDPFTGAA